MTAKDSYDMLCSNGDLKEFFPEMTGDWNKDKKEFKEEYDKITGDLQ